jgi:hypothetical protein
MSSAATGPYRVRAVPARLLFVLAASLVPAALLACLLVGYDYYHRERDRLVRDSLATARALAAALDMEFKGAKLALYALASSPQLSSGDLAAFYGQAQASLKDQTFTNLVLLDASGRQLMNTAMRFGEPLPAQGNPPQLQRIFETGEAVVTDLFTGPVLRRQLMAIGVPVRRDGKTRYALNAGVDPKTLSELLTGQRLPQGWIAAIFDTQGTIVARTHEAERFVGQKGSSVLVRRMQEVREDALESRTLEGIPVLTVFSRAAVSGWAVAIGIPQRELTTHLWYSMARLFIVAFVALITALGLAALFGRRLMR